ncbi:uncharacterized protein LOC135671931 [Musa acuminata AAA Group]|uniref:uncharacterized protein LOC135671931 n=1 Tax=Musa acuminata AAA Group TaxID=214697 RepID=UPI0031DEDA77
MRKRKYTNSDTAEMSVTVPEDSSNFIILEGTSTKRCRKNKKRLKNKFSNTNSATSLSGTSEIVSVPKGDEVSHPSNQAALMEKETDAMTDAFADSKMEEVIPQTDFMHKAGRRRRRRRKKRKPDNSQNVDTIKNNVMSNIDVEDTDSNVCANQASRNKTTVDVSLNLLKKEGTSSIHGRKGRKKERSTSCASDKQACTAGPCTSHPFAASVNANGSSRISASDECKKRNMEVKCDINVEAASKEIAQNTGNLLDYPGEGQQCYTAAEEGSLQLLPAGMKEGLSVPPSPIRGVIEKLSSPNLPMKQHNQLGSCNEECSSFSFQMDNKVFMDDPSMNHSVEAIQSIIRIGSERVKLATDENNAADYKHKHTDASTGQEKEFARSSMSNVSKDVVLLMAETSLRSRKKLLVLDLNGLLADITTEYHGAHMRVAGKSVFKRPFCDDFLKFCFERFHVGVWSSRKSDNVRKVVDYLMGDLKHKLLFCWGQSKCTDTGYRTIENIHKPLVLKELKKLWNKEDHDLPWEKGEYSPSNTLLVDDSPYKAICNPPHTAIFPYPYRFTEKKDNSLGSGGNLRVYLEGLAVCHDVQLYVQDHPFGQKAIADSNPSWKFYLRIIDRIQQSSSLTS